MNTAGQLEETLALAAALPLVRGVMELMAEMLV